jgi:cell division septation protein DedD
MAHGNLVRSYFACNAQAALLNPSLVKVTLSTKEALAYAALLSYWGCDTITPTWDALLSRSRLGKTALSAALDSLEVKRTLERRRFTDRTGRRHVIYFLNVEALFEKDVIEACGMEDDLYKHSIKEGASDNAVLARVRHLNTTGWKSTRFTTKQVKESLAPEEESSCGYDEDSLEGFLLSGFPDEMPVEEPREEIYPREGMQPLFGDGADLEDDAQNAPELASDSSDPWPTAVTIPGGSEWAPDDAEDTSMVFDAPAQRETIQERAERIIHDRTGDDVIDAEIIDAEIVEDETPSDTLIDVPVSQELTVAAPKAPVKAKKSKKRNDYPDDFEEFWRTYPRHEDKKKAFKVWQTALKNGATADEIIAGAARYAKYRAGEPEQYTKHPSTWLNGDCWENEYSTAGTGYGSGQYGSRLSPEEAALNREAIASTFADRLREWGYSSVEEYREHTEGLSRMYREDAEEQRAQELAILNAF